MSKLLELDPRDMGQAPVEQKQEGLTNLVAKLNRQKFVNNLAGDYTLRPGDDKRAEEAATQAAIRQGERPERDEYLQSLPFPHRYTKEDLLDQRLKRYPLVDTTKAVQLTLF